MMRVAITGAEGVVGSVLRTGLTGRFELQALVRTPQPFTHRIVDVCDYEGICRGLDGCNAVIHLAAAASLDATWEEILAANIVGTRNVLEASRQHSLQTVVLASSGHVLGALEDAAGPALYDLDDPRQFDETTPPAPDSLYAVSKLYGESLGHFYANRYGLRVICVRLGTVLPTDDFTVNKVGRGRSAGMSPEQRFVRLRTKWLSHGDCTALYSACLQANHLHFAVVFGTSNNPRQIWSLRTARSLLGYAPQDAAPRDFPAAC